MDCIKYLKEIKDSKVTDRDIFGALLSMCGAKVSNMPDEVEGQETYSNSFELFDPEKVRKSDIEDLPDHWRMVWDMHNRKDMGDCRYLRYRYVHVPITILPKYPRVPCRGIFCLDNRKVRANKITADDLIFIGNEF